MKIKGDKMLNLRSFDTVSMHEDGFKVELNLPNGEPAYLDVDSKKPKKRLAIIIKGAKASSSRNELLKMFRTNKKAQESSSPDKDETFEEIVEKTSKKLACVTIGWENIPDWDGGGILAFSFDDAVRLYSNYESIREQVVEAHENDENFIKG